MDRAVRCDATDTGYNRRGIAVSGLQEEAGDAAAWTARGRLTEPKSRLLFLKTANIIRGGRRFPIEDAPPASLFKVSDSLPNAPLCFDMTLTFDVLSVSRYCATRRRRNAERCVTEKT